MVIGNGKAFSTANAQTSRFDIFFTLPLVSLSLILDPCRQHAQIRVSEFTNSCVYLCLCAWPQLQPQLLPLSLNIGIKRLFIFGNHMWGSTGTNVSEPPKKTRTDWVFIVYCWWRLGIESFVICDSNLLEEKDINALHLFMLTNAAACKKLASIKLYFFQYCQKYHYRKFSTHL